MPFSKFDVDPEHIEAMRAAFYRVWDVLQLDCDADDRMTELVVMKIVGLAKAGEHDPERLCIAVLAELESPPVGGVERVDRGDTGITPLRPPDGGQPQGTTVTGAG